MGRWETIYNFLGHSFQRTADKKWQGRKGQKLDQETGSAKTGQRIIGQIMQAMFFDHI